MESIYQEQILNLAKYAKLYKKIKNYNYIAEVHNPTCGDKIITKILVKNNKLVDFGVDIWGCALCEAGAGLWLRNVVDYDFEKLFDLEKEVNDWIKGRTKYTKLKYLENFEPIKKIKNRHKCVTLAFDTYKKFK